MKKFFILLFGHFIDITCFSNLENILPKTNFGLYLDCELILLRNPNGQQMNKKEKLSLKFTRTLVLALAFKQILKK